MAHLPGESAASELGGALRRWRERITPGQAGLPAGGDRRVPGLRRATERYPDDRAVADLVAALHDRLRAAA